jgi:hypothetical protein
MQAIAGIRQLEQVTMAGPRKTYGGLIPEMVVFGYNSEYHD